MIKRNQKISQVLFLLPIIILLTYTNQSKAASLIDPFIGTYTGFTTYQENGLEINRNLGVNIEKMDEGFRVQWAVTTIKQDHKLKTKNYSINFMQTKRKNVFKAAQKVSLFGTMQPLDPLDGEPYIWSKINQRTLTVYALLIHDDGGYELLTYDRSIVKKGLNLNYSRMKNGVQLKTITSFLKKQ